MPTSKGKTIREVFDECQTSVYNHAKLVKSLNKTYQQEADKHAFHQEFLHHLKYAMVVFKREPAVERILEFAAKFATSVENDEPAVCSADDEGDSQESKVAPENLLTYLFNYIFKVHGARDRAVRFRACQMINKLLNNMGEDADIDDDLYNGIYDGMLIRLRDTIPVVRVQAVLALARLQNPEDADCPVIAAYLYLLEGDLSYEVRRAVLTSIAPSLKTLPSILKTTRDIKEVVRKIAFQILSEKVHIKSLTIAQRVTLLKDGLSDRAESVREACATKLLQAWLKAFDSNVLDLLKCLDVENSSDDTAEMMLKVIFDKVEPAELVGNFDLLDESHMIPASELTCEGSLYWRHVGAYLKTQGPTGEVLLDNIAPTVSAYCDYLQSFVKTLQSDITNEEEVEETLKKEFIAKQLLHVAGWLDLSDEVGRKRLDTTVHDMLVAPHIPAALVKLLVDLFNRIHTNDEERITLMAEIIADVREPITTVEVEISDEDKRKKDLKLANLRMQLNETKDALEDLVAKQDFSKAAELKNKLEEIETSKASLLEQSNVSLMEKKEEKNDATTLVKCLTIASEMMQYLSVTGLNPTLQTLVDTLVLPGIQNQDPAVRNMAVNCIGLASLLSKTFACQQLLLLMQISQVDQETIKVTALQAIFDLLHLYGLEAFQVDASEEPDSEDNAESDEEQGDDGDNKKGQGKSAANSAVAILSGLLESESSEIRTVAAEGMAKLLLAGRVSSPKLLRRLLILWYNPTTEEDLHLRHCLGAFFPVFAMAGRSQQECVEQAFLPTLQTLFDAPTTSPLASINENNVAELLVHLTDHRNLKGSDQETVEDSTVHDNLSLKLCNEILEDQYTPGVRTLCKSLNMLQLSYSNQTLMKDLDVLATQMVEVVEEKVSKRQVEKFQQAIAKAINNNAASTMTGEGDASAPAAAMEVESQDEEGANSQEEEEENSQEDEGVNSQEDEEGPSQEDNANSQEDVNSQDEEKEVAANTEEKTKSPVAAVEEEIDVKSTTKRKTRGSAKTKAEKELSERLEPQSSQRSTRRTRTASKVSVASQKKSTAKAPPATRGRNTRATKVKVDLAQLLSESDTDDAETGKTSKSDSKENSATFKTPSTTTKGRKTKVSKKAAAPQCEIDSLFSSPDVVTVPMNRKSRKTKVNLSQLLSDSESDAENVAVTKVSTKNRVTRRQGRRIARPFVDLSNTDDSM